MSAMSGLFVGCATSYEGQEAQKVTAEELNVTPQKAEFVLGPGDEVEVMVWRNDDLHLTQRISPYGEIHYPLAGDIKAAGMTISELKNTITTGLQPYIVDPQVTVSVVTYVDQKVIVLGEVNRPGVFPVTGPMTVLEGITAAEGFTLDAAEESVILIRGREANQPLLARLDLEAATEKGAVQENVPLQGGDIIYVPSSPVADVGRFFDRVRQIMLPIVTSETSVILVPLVQDALQGKATRTVVTTGH